MQWMGKNDLSWQESDKAEEDSKDSKDDVGTFKSDIDMYAELLISEDEQQDFEGFKNAIVHWVLVSVYNLCISC